MALMKRLLYSSQKEWRPVTNLLSRATQMRLSVPNSKRPLPRLTMASKNSCSISAGTVLSLFIKLAQDEGNVEYYDHIELTSLQPWNIMLFTQIFAKHLGTCQCQVLQIQARLDAKEWFHYAACTTSFSIHEVPFRLSPRSKISVSHTFMSFLVVRHVNQNLIWFATRGDHQVRHLLAGALRS